MRKEREEGREGEGGTHEPDMKTLRGAKSAI